LRDHVFSFQSRVEAGLRFGWLEVPDGLEQAAVVEPIDSFQRRVFHHLEAAPRSAAMDHLGFEKAIYGHGQGVVIAVPDTADEEVDAGNG